MGSDHVTRVFVGIVKWDVVRILIQYLTSELKSTNEASTVSPVYFIILWTRWAGLTEDRNTPVSQVFSAKTLWYVILMLEDVTVRRLSN